MDEACRTPSMYQSAGKEAVGPAQPAPVPGVHVECRARHGELVHGVLDSLLVSHLRLVVAAAEVVRPLVLPSGMRLRMATMSCWHVSYVGCWDPGRDGKMVGEGLAGGGLVGTFPCNHGSFMLVTRLGRESGSMIRTTGTRSVKRPTTSAKGSMYVSLYSLSPSAQLAPATSR